MTTREKIVLLGSGGHAKIVADIIEEAAKYDIVGVVTEHGVDRFLGYPVLGNDDVLPRLFQEGLRKAAMGVGGFRENTLRKNVYIKTKSMGFCFPPMIHPSAVISKTAVIGEGAVIFAGVVVNPCVIVGENVIIATGSTIDHDTTIEDHVLVSAGVTVGANDVIRAGALLALGSKIVSGLTVGKDVLVGAGAVVTRDL